MLTKLTAKYAGQSELFEWLDTVDQDYLRYVTDVRFKLHDIDPDEIVGALGKRLRDANITRARSDRSDIHRVDYLDNSDNPYYEACYLDLRRIGAAFQLLANVRYFTLIKAAQGDPKPSRPMENSLSRILAQCFPDLRSMCTDVINLPLDFISNKPKLKRLRFPGTTITHPRERANVIEQLSDLRLEIVRRSFDHAYEAQSDCLSNMVEHLPPLRSLSVIEHGMTPNVAHNLWRSHTESLKDHCKSLNVLKILVEIGDSAYKDVLISNAASLVSNASLTHLEIINTWSFLFRSLPPTIETFVLRLDLPYNRNVQNVPSFKELMAHVRWKFENAGSRPHVSKMPKLRRIMIYLNPRDIDHELEDSNEDSDDDEDDEEEESLSDILSSARTILKRFGIGLFWKKGTREDFLELFSMP